MAENEKYKQMLAKKQSCANEILQNSRTMLEFMQKPDIEKAFEMLDLRQAFFEDMQKLDEEIVSDLRGESSRRGGRLRRILSLNEPENLEPFEEELLLAVKSFVKTMAKVAEINNALQLEFQKEQDKIVKKLSDLGEQRRKLLHSKKFAKTMLAGKEKQNWDVKL